MPEASIDILIRILLPLSLLALCLWLMVAGIRRERKLSALQRRFDSLSSSLNALCSGTAGVDERISRLERLMRDLDHRQSTMEAQQQGERPFGEAIQLVHQGATAERLVEELGLSRSEADLVVMLHGMKQVG